VDEDDHDLHARVAGRIRERAARQGLDLTELADKAGISRGHLFQILGLRKSPTVSLLGKLARAMGDTDTSAFFRPYRPGTQPPGPKEYRPRRKKTSRGDR
jgi:transcriptional regulator with XRE-family HTH domain